MTADPPPGRRDDRTPRGAASGPGRSPTDPAFALGVLAAMVSFAAVAAYSWVGLAVGAVGTVALAAGGYLGSTAAVRAGSAGLAAASVLGGLGGAPPLAVGLGAWSALVAWDATTYALVLADHVGDATDRGTALAHVRDATLVGAGTVVVAAGAFLVGTTGARALAGVAAVAAVALALALALD